LSLPLFLPFYLDGMGDLTERSLVGDRATVLWGTDSFPAFSVPGAGG
jgi:hypothetical protein